MSDANYFNVLIIEDEVEFSLLLEDTIRELSNDVLVHKAFSKSEAEEIIKDPNKFFDLITLDLKLPINSNDYDKSADHGMALLGICSEFCPGTPILVLSGSTHDSHVHQLLRASYKVDIWGEGTKRQTIDHLTKTEVDDFINRISPIYHAVTSLSEIELVPSEAGSLPIKHDRLLRIFIRDKKAIRANYRENKSGLSSSRVYFLDLYDERGAPLLRAVAKCGESQDIVKEIDNHNEHVIKLKPAASPRFIKSYEFGAKNNNAAFYSMASDYELSFFRAAKSGQLNNEILNTVKSLVSPWDEVRYEIRNTVSDIRRELVTDLSASQLFEKYNLDWAHTFEQKAFQVKKQVIHGDLHGENILINTRSKDALLIDYGDVKNASAPLDPITLECSFLFHPSGFSDSEWPTIEQLNNWDDLNIYLVNCPCPEVIKFCREWALSATTGNRCLAACLYAYALRQLKYEDTDKDKALELIYVAKKIYERS